MQPEAKEPDARHTISPRLPFALVDRVDRFGVDEFTANRTEAVQGLMERGLATTLLSDDEQKRLLGVRAAQV
jgi:hypothetical protein